MTRAFHGSDAFRCAARMRVLSRNAAYWPIIVIHRGSDDLERGEGWFLFDDGSRIWRRDYCDIRVYGPDHFGSISREPRP